VDFTLDWLAQFIRGREGLAGMYTLLVCADLYGEKINLEITFPAMPTIGELQRKVVEVYSAEAQVKRPLGSRRSSSRWRACKCTTMSC
jgi:hypothetical protein